MTCFVDSQQPSRSIIVIQGVNSGHEHIVSHSQPRQMLYLPPQLVDRQPQCIADHLHRIEGRIRQPSLQSAQICLIEAAQLPEFHLGQAGLNPELSDTSTKPLRERLLLHTGECPPRTSIHINTNSYNGHPLSDHRESAMGNAPKAQRASTAASGKKPLTLLRAFGYSVAVVAVMVGCMALSERAENLRSSPEFMAREQQRAAQEAEVASKKKAEAVAACVEDDVEAFVMSQDFVRRGLKAPVTAKFPTITAPGVRTSYIGNCAHEVRAFVDAQNSFGAMLRSPYTARLQKDPITDKWRLVDLRIAEP